MDWNMLLKSVKVAISEYKSRDEPVPEMIKRAFEWVEPRTIRAEEDIVVDREDMTSLFLHMAGWSH